MLEPNPTPLPEALTASEVEALCTAARLFGDLLLTELDEHRLAWLRLPEVGGHLAHLGVDLPGDDTGVDELASQFHRAFLAPDRGGAPLVASLWTEGRYEGSQAARIRDLAAAASVQFHRQAVRGAPVDHLGVVLHLWAATATRAPRVADDLAATHLSWSEAPLARLGGEESFGFYASVARATQDLVKLLRRTSVAR